jgi:ABC-type bacteriocin/lantibiotic exporter with double-glycine peptidase domain
MLFRPPSTHLLDVPHVQQHNTGDCLAACAAMVCQYLKIPVQYEQLVKLLAIEPGVGTAFSNIAHLQKVRVTVVHQTGGQLSQLYELLGLGWPIIASVQTGDLPHWAGQNMLHAVVIVGMAPEYIYLNDPGFPKAPIRVSIGDFDLAWLAQDERYAVLAPS